MRKQKKIGITKKAMRVTMALIAACTLFTGCGNSETTVKLDPGTSGRL